MYSASELKSMLFIDIETTAQYKTLNDLKSSNKGLHDLWLQKADQIKSYESQKSDLSDEDFYQSNASLHPEFGKIVTISIGQIQFDEIGMPQHSKIKSYYGDDEHAVLSDFNQTLGAVFNKNGNVQLTGHNIKKFDAPWIIKRCLINGITPTAKLHLQKQKPWENCLLDTLEVWKFGGYNGASLGILCNVLGIPTPKDDISGSDVNRVYWEGDLERIKDYCEKDVSATMNVMLKISSMELI
jgi:predicted PolB exonuclease-like 3'-5' exonuclease